MTGETDNLLLTHLGEINAKLGSLEKRFDLQDKRWNEAQNYLSQTLGMGLIGQRKNDEQDARIGDLEVRAKRIEDLHTDLRRWVTRIDERG